MGFGSGWCHCHPKTLSSLASFKSRPVLPIWYWLTQVVLEKRPLNGCSSGIWWFVHGTICDMGYESAWTASVRTWQNSMSGWDVIGCNSLTYRYQCLQKIRKSFIFYFISVHPHICDELKLNKIRQMLRKYSVYFTFISSQRVRASKIR